MPLFVRIKQSIVYFLLVVCTLASSEFILSAMEPKTQEPILMLPGPKYKSVIVDCEGTVSINENSEQRLGTGGILWDGAVVLLGWLKKNREALKSKRILELGAGTGLVSICCARIGAREVVATDVAEVIDNLSANLQTNLESSEVEYKACKVDWESTENEDLGHFDIVVGSDIIWLRHLVLPLVNTINQFLNTKNYMILAHQTRSLMVDDLFFSEIKKTCSVSKIPNSELAVEHQKEDKIGLYRITKQPTEK